MPRLWFAESSLEEVWVVVGCQRRREYIEAAPGTATREALSVLPAEAPPQRRPLRRCRETPPRHAAADKQIFQIGRRRRNAPLGAEPSWRAGKPCQEAVLTGWWCGHLARGAWGKRYMYTYRECVIRISGLPAVLGVPEMVSEGCAARWANSWMTVRADEKLCWGEEQKKA